ncbi:hypothetical protein AVEN_120364-1 [Araneus ventricosus]|uniref:Uncharacterized protein n=1 Tax=Araneus ventricosus TaxID=182803 RepID=A0A4Y2WJW6_ARAVE|nr:hypothetical protein AVEN_120364-1 [Araneus ventricosus]
MESRFPAMLVMRLGREFYRDSQYDAMAEKCSLCEDYVVTDKCGVGEKGIDGLIKASIARKDGKHELFRGQKKIVLHASCRKKHTRPQSITRDLKIAVLDGQP